jgi:hypothetical protein
MAFVGATMSNKRTGLTTVETLVVVVLLAAAVGIGYLVFGQPNKAAPQNRQSVGDLPLAAPSPDAAASANEARRKADADALAAKQVEDARRQEADRLVQAERARASSIHGAAWVVRKNGDSIILRGLHIHLLRPAFADSSPVCDLAAVYIPSLEELRKITNRLLEIEGEHPLTSDNPNDISVRMQKSQVDILKADVKSYTQRIEIIKKLAQQHPSDMKDVDAYQLLLVASISGKVDFPYNSVSVIDTDTDVDGKYTLSNVAPGDYCVFANFDSGMFSVDWLVPIHVAPGTQASLDLNNDNAIHIHNQTP